jgi:hypothetical protein
LLCSLLKATRLHLITPLPQEQKFRAWGCSLVAKKVQKRAPRDTRLRRRPPTQVLCGAHSLDMPTRAHGPAAAAEPAAAVVPALMWVMSLTLEPIRASQSVVNVDAARHEACLDALGSFDALFAAWVAELYLHHALAFEEFGKLMGGAHLQTGWAVLSNESDEAKVCSALKARLKPHMDQYTAGGKVKWTFRKLHVHTDPKLLDGYCVKQHPRYASWDACPLKHVGALYTRGARHTTRSAALNSSWLFAKLTSVCAAARAARAARAATDYLVAAYQHWLAT